MSDLNEYVAEQAALLREAYLAKIEGYIRLHVRPRPRWMPRFLYVLLMRQIVLEESPLRFALEKSSGRDGAA